MYIISDSWSTNFQIECWLKLVEWCLPRHNFVFDGCWSKVIHLFCRKRFVNRLHLVKLFRKQIDRPPVPPMFLFGCLIILLVARKSIVTKKPSSFSFSKHYDIHIQNQNFVIASEQQNFRYVLHHLLHIFKMSRSTIRFFKFKFYFNIHCLQISPNAAYIICYWNTFVCLVELFTLE